MDAFIFLTGFLVGAGFTLALVGVCMFGLSKITKSIKNNNEEKENETNSNRRIK